jgi:hypothetical protein
VGCDHLNLAAGRATWNGRSDFRARNHCELRRRAVKSHACPHPTNSFPGSRRQLQPCRRWAVFRRTGGARQPDYRSCHRCPRISSLRNFVIISSPLCWSYEPSWPCGISILELHVNWLGAIRGRTERRRRRPPIGNWRGVQFRLSSPPPKATSWEKRRYSPVWLFCAANPGLG